MPKKFFTTNSRTQKPHTKFHSKDNNRYWVCLIFCLEAPVAHAYLSCISRTILCFELMAKHAKMMKTKQRKKILLKKFCSARSCGFFGTLIKHLRSSSLQQKHRHRMELKLQINKLEILHCRADSFQCRISNSSKSCGIFDKNRSDHGYQWRPEAAKKEMTKYFWWIVKHH